MRRFRMGGGRGGRTPLILLVLAVATAAAAREGTLSKIAFSSDRDPQFIYPQIYLMSPDGSAITRISTTFLGGDAPAISPDGTRVVFENPSAGRAQLFTVSVTGTDERRLTTISGDAMRGAWSADGQRLAFTRYYNGTFRLWLIGADGTDQRQLSTVAANEDEAVWSPDGTKIAFVSNRDGHFEIYTMSPDGTDQQRATNSDSDKSGPDWSPDGTKIAYRVCAIGTYTPASLHVMNADGSGDVALTDGTRNDFGARWSPDGGRIAFASDRDLDGAAEVYTMKADGTDVVRVTQGSAIYDVGDWGLAALPTGIGNTEPGPPGRGSLGLRCLSLGDGAQPTFEFSLAEASTTTLRLYDCAGRLVRTLLDQPLAPGTHVVRWDGRDAAGSRTPSGVYLCRIVSGGQQTVAKIVRVD